MNLGQNGCSVGRFCVWSLPLPPFDLALVTFLSVRNSRLWEIQWDDGQIN